MALKKRYYKVTTVRLPERIYNRLKHLADHHPEDTMSDIMRKVLEKELFNDEEKKTDD